LGKESTVRKNPYESPGILDCAWPPECGRDPRQVATDLAVRIANAFGIEDDTFRVATGKDKPFVINFADAMMAQLNEGKMTFAEISVEETTFVGGKR